MTETVSSLGARLGRIQRGAGVLGALALAAAMVGAWRQPETLFPAYLVGFIFWLNLSLGAWALLMVHELVGGDWGVAIRPIFDAAARVLPAMAVLFVPLLFGLRTIYPWARLEEVASDARLRHLQPYLNPAFFTARSAGYFLCWILVSRLLHRWSARDTLDDQVRRRRLSAGGLVLYVLTVYFASIDWALSTEPRWSSSIYGLLFVADQGVSGFALGTAVLIFLARDPLFDRTVKTRVLQDLGNLLLTSVLFWTYVSFSQYLIIWSANLPREAVWVIRRTQTGWGVIAQLLVALHFVVPFLLLLFRVVKTTRGSIGAIAAGLLVLRLVDVCWKVLPAFEPGGPVVHGTTVAAILGIGGVWIAVFARALRQQPRPLAGLVLAETGSHE